jgi:hypothetical protein
MFMAVRILRLPQILMMRQVISIIESRNRANGCKNQYVGPKVIPLNIRKHAPVHSIVTDDKNSIVAIANDRNRQQDRPPRWMGGYRTPCNDDTSPAPG